MIASRNEDKIYVRCWHFSLTFASSHLSLSTWSPHSRLYGENENKVELWGENLKVREEDVDIIVGSSEWNLMKNVSYVHKIFCRLSNLNGKRNEKGKTTKRWNIKNHIINYSLTGLRGNLYLYSWLILRAPRAMKLHSLAHENLIQETLLNWKLFCTSWTHDSAIANKCFLHLSDRFFFIVRCHLSLCCWVGKCEWEEKCIAKNVAGWKLKTWTKCYTEKAMPHARRWADDLYRFKNFKPLKYLREGRGLEIPSPKKDKTWIK